MSKIILVSLLFILLGAPVVLAGLLNDDVGIICGDGVCQLDSGETIDNCPEDCEVGVLDKFSSASDIKSLVVRVIGVIIVLATVMGLMLWLYRNLK